MQEFEKSKTEEYCRTKQALANKVRQLEAELRDTQGSAKARHVSTAQKELKKAIVGIKHEQAEVQE